MEKRGSGLSNPHCASKELAKHGLSLERRFLAQKYEIKNALFTIMEVPKIALKNAKNTHFFMKLPKNMPLYLRFNAQNKPFPYNYMQAC